tara:strand:+ start:39 stop:338 length:300 start_codon:yes stop_codon:yes gene_type:complete
MTQENKEWMAHALFLGYDHMELFSEKVWEWISEPMDGLPLNEQCVFYQAYVKFGGKGLRFANNKTYDDREALSKAIEYAQDKIYEAFHEIEKRFKLGGD